MTSDLLTRRLPRALALTALFAAPSALRAQTWDLAAQWSAVTNPSGPWALRRGVSLLPHVGDFTAVVAGQRNAFAPSAAPGNFLPAWFQAEGTLAGNDWLPGDVIVHSNDPSNGAAPGPANVTWTSAIAGTISVTGGVWRTRDLGRSSLWTLLLNGTALTSGVLQPGDPFTRDDLFSFGAGSGGVGAVTGIQINPGDVLELRVERNAGSPFGDFAGVRLAVVGAASPAVVPEPRAVVLLGVGLAGAGISYRLSRRA